jgi:hypothetical protein
MSKTRNHQRHENIGETSEEIAVIHISRSAKLDKAHKGSVNETPLPKLNQKMTSWLHQQLATNEFMFKGPGN